MNDSQETDLDEYIHLHPNQDVMRCCGWYTLFVIQPQVHPCSVVNMVQGLRGLAATSGVGQAVQDHVCDVYGLCVPSGPWLEVHVSQHHDGYLEAARQAMSQLVPAAFHDTIPCTLCQEELKPGAPLETFSPSLSDGPELGTGCCLP